MRIHTLRLLAVSATYFALSPAFAADAAAGTTTTVSTTATSDTDRFGATAAVPATRIARRFEDLAGSPENAASLVAGLRSGTAITLTSPTSATGIRLTPTTKPMGYGNVNQALTLAQRQLAAQGITRPTPAQLSTALNGGTLTRVDSSGATRTVEMAGVLQLRSQGMGWGQIAHQLSVSPGNPPAMTATPTGTTTTSVASTTQGSTSLRGTSYRHGAIVSGDGAIMQGRVPGYSSTTEPRGQSSGTALAQANGKAAVHARMPVIQAGGSASLGGGHALGTAGGHGMSLVQARSHGRL